MKLFLITLIPILLLGCQNKIYEKTVIQSENAPKAIGPYSQAIKVGQHLYLAGQIAIDPKTNEFVPGGIVEQTNQVSYVLTSLLSCSALISATALTLKGIWKINSSCAIELLHISKITFSS